MKATNAALQQSLSSGSLVFHIAAFNL